MHGQRMRAQANCAAFAPDAARRNPADGRSQQQPENPPTDAHEMALFSRSDAQRLVQKVEAILSPEQFPIQDIEG